MTKYTTVRIEGKDGKVKRYGALESSYLMADGSEVYMAQRGKAIYREARRDAEGVIYKLAKR